MSSRCSLVLLVFIVFVRFSAQAAAGEAALIAQKVEKAFSAKDLLTIPEEESGVKPILQPVCLMKEIKRQVQSYAVEGNIDLDDSPLDWWKNNENDFHIFPYWHATCSALLGVRQNLNVCFRTLPG